MTTLFTGIIPDSIEALQARYGADILCTPLIEMVPVADDAPLREAISRIASYRYLVFTSRHAVSFFFGTACPTLFERYGLKDAIHVSSSDSCLRILSIGTTTSLELKGNGITGFEQPENDNSYGVIDWFARQPRGRVLIPRSSLALDIIPDGLRRLGFEVDTVTAYVNRMPSSPQQVDLGLINRIVFTSPSTIDNFIRLYGALPADKEFVARGPVTEQHLQTIIKQQSL